MNNGWQQVLTSAWDRQAWWLWLLRPLEMLFRAAAALRRALYRSGILGSYRAPAPLVVIGNITVGGTGKTPVVIALAQAMQQRGIRPGVVSRGHGADAGVFPRIVDASSTAADCGDEALLLWRRLQCPCVVAPSRVSAARLLLEQFPVDIVFSDDGLQHYAMWRDMEIILYDARRRWGNGWCLPAGPLREPLARLDSADFILCRGQGDRRVTYIAQDLVNLHSGEVRPVSSHGLAGRVHAVAGIGQPGQFFEMLEQLGFTLQRHSFPDHHPYSAGDFTGLTDRPVIMTEKDAVKCRDLAGPDSWYLRISAAVPEAVVAAVASLVKH